MMGLLEIAGGDVQFYFLKKLVLSETSLHMDLALFIYIFSLTK